MDNPTSVPYPQQPETEFAPQTLVATTNAILSAFWQKEKRSALIDAGFDWAAFEERHVELESAGIGYRSDMLPIELDPSAGEVAGSVLSELRADLSRLRQLAPNVLTGVDQIDELIACMAPDGTQHAELEGHDPAHIYVVALQDMPFDFVEPELPRISKAINLQRLSLFGIGLRNEQLGRVDFSGLTKLRSLNLFENRLERFPAVTMLENLESLVLTQNSRLAQVPSNLAAMTGLRLLDLRGTAVPVAEHAAVRSALPGCDVRF